MVWLFANELSSILLNLKTFDEKTLTLHDFFVLEILGRSGHTCSMLTQNIFISIFIYLFYNHYDLAKLKDV